MPLTKEQFSALRQKGLSVEQIVAFEKGADPKTLRSERERANEGFLASVGRGIVTPVVSTLVRPFQAVAAVAGADAKTIDKKTRELLPYFGDDLDTPKKLGDVKRDIGRGVETVALGIGGGGAVSTVQTGLRGAIRQSAYQGLRVGAASGGTTSFGQALQQAESSPSDVAYQTLFGTALGAGAGLALGAVTPVAVRGAQKAKELTNLDSIESKLYSVNQEIFKPTSTNLRKWQEKKVDPIKTFTREFGPEAIPTKGNTLRLDDFIEQTNARYQAGSEGFNTILRNSPEVVNLAERERQAQSALSRSNLTPSAKQAALARTQVEFAALRAEADKAGYLFDDNVPAWYADNLKDRFWRGTKYFGTEEGGIANEVNRTLGFSFKEGIEEVVEDVNVKAYNKQLQELIELRDFLESRNGKVPGTGGKMARYTARIAGSVAGSQGGPLGTIAGMVTADQVAQALVSPTARTWLIRRQLQKLSPEARASLQKEAEGIIANMAKRRAETLRLPPSSAIVTPNTKGTPGPNYNLPYEPAQSKGTTFEAPAQQINREAFGAVAGIEKDEEGKLSFDPKKAALGVAGVAGFTKFSPKLTQVYNGEKDITTKTLQKLKGRSTVSKQFISDLTNSPDLKQAERDIIRRVLADFKDGEVPVKDFANKVKSELLPLKRKGGEQEMRIMSGNGTERISRENRYENITLPEELRGPVANYSEHIYESPIKTSAGSTHFQDASDSYFAHSRIEDLPEGGSFRFNPQTGESNLEKAGDTRRVIEIQSDLFQKGRLEGEAMPKSQITRPQYRSVLKPEEAKIYDKAYEGLMKNGSYDREAIKTIDELEKVAYERLSAPRTSELSKLEPYRNTWHERVIREEVKKAAQDGKTKLQFPTGETAMKIEGLGDDGAAWAIQRGNSRVIPEISDLKVGKAISDDRTGQEWIITDVLGDGKFKAVNDVVAQNNEPAYRYLQKIGKDDDGRFPTLGELKAVLDDKEFKGLIDILNKENVTETFDISGKVDTNNPIYKFYEKEVGKYLKNKYNAQLVTDAQGVKWWEINVPKDAKKMPIEAFAALPLLSPIKPLAKEPADNER